MSEHTPGRADLAEAAARLRALHSGPDPLVLPNVWDAASAHAVAEAGFPAVATTSSGVSAALGSTETTERRARESSKATSAV